MKESKQKSVSTKEWDVSFRIEDCFDAYHVKMSC